MITRPTCVMCVLVCCISASNRQGSRQRRPRRRKLIGGVRTTAALRTYGPAGGDGSWVVVPVPESEVGESSLSFCPRTESPYFSLVLKAVSKTSLSLSVACFEKRPTRPATAAIPYGLMSSLLVLPAKKPPRIAK